MSISTKFSLKSSKTIARLTTPVTSSHGPVPCPRAPPVRHRSLSWCPSTPKEERRMENKRRAWRAALRTLSPRREAHRTLDPMRGPSYARLDSEFHMKAEVPVSARNQRRRSQKIWGGAEVRQSAGMGPENRRSPANTRLAQANKREAWQTWQTWQSPFFTKNCWLFDRATVLVFRHDSSS